MVSGSGQNLNLDPRCFCFLTLPGIKSLFFVYAKPSKEVIYASDFLNHFSLNLKKKNYFLWGTYHFVIKVSLKFCLRTCIRIPNPDPEDP